MENGSGKQLGPYDMVSLLGAGGMGKVYRMNWTLPDVGSVTVQPVLTAGGARPSAPNGLQWTRPNKSFDLCRENLFTYFLPETCDRQAARRAASQ